MLIVYNHNFTIGPHAVIMHSTGLCCASDMIVQLIMLPVIIRFLKVEGCVKVPWAHRPFIKNTLVLFLRNGSSRLSHWALVGNHSSFSSHPVQETKISKPQITPIIHPLHKPVFLLMPPFPLTAIMWSSNGQKLLYRALIPTIHCEKPAVCYTHIFMQREIREAK